jgi:hypothetical protein
LQTVRLRFKKPNERRKSMDQEQKNTANQVNLRIETLILDDKIRSRLKPDERAIQEYAEEMTQGTIFPPITVYSNGTLSWVVNGFHRVMAALMAGKTEILAEVTEGDYRSAFLASAGVNRTNGVRRTNEEKRLAVSKLLQDAEWSQWSDEVVAGMCGVSAPFVGLLRKELTPNSSESSQVRRGKDNRLIKTGKIGKRPRLKKSGSAENKPLEAQAASTTQPQPFGGERNATAPLPESAGPTSPVEEAHTETVQDAAVPIKEGTGPKPQEEVAGNGEPEQEPTQAESPMKEESSGEEREQSSADSEMQKVTAPISNGEHTMELKSQDETDDNVELLKRENQLLTKRVEDLERENAALKEENEYLRMRVESTLRK